MEKLCTIQLAFDNGMYSIVRIPERFQAEHNLGLDYYYASMAVSPRQDELEGPREFYRAMVSRACYPLIETSHRIAFKGPLF